MSRLREHWSKFSEIADPEPENAFYAGAISAYTMAMQEISESESGIELAGRLESLIDEVREFMVYQKYPRNVVN